ncbi:MAG: hypothetical protein V3W41_11430 [Planctomycetota bacterium]
MHRMSQPDQTGRYGRLRRRAAGLEVFDSEAYALRMKWERYGMMETLMLHLEKEGELSDFLDRYQRE